MKKLILFLSLIMIISVMSCNTTTTSNETSNTTTTSNETLISQIVGEWELRYTIEDETYIIKYAFDSDNTFYSNEDLNGEKSLSKGNYSIDENNSQITLNYTEIAGEQREESFTMTFASDGNTLAFEALVGGNTETLIGEWRLYSRHHGHQSHEIIYNFKTDGILAIYLEDVVETEDGLMMHISADWELGSDNTIIFSNSDSDYIIANGDYFYQIVGNGMVFSDTDNLDILTYKRVGN